MQTCRKQNNSDNRNRLIEYHKKNSAKFDREITRHIENQRNRREAALKLNNFCNLRSGTSHVLKAQSDTKTNETFGLLG